MADQVLLVLSTFPDLERAREIARHLVEEKCAACVNILPPVESIYRWQGKVEAAGEVLACFKIAAGGFEVFQARLRQLHPYDVPEIIALSVTTGLPDYLKWVAENCRRD